MFCYNANTEHVKATMEDEVVLQDKPGILLQLSHTLNTTIISIKCHVFYQELNLDCQKSQCAMYCSCHTVCAILTARPEQMEELQALLLM